MDYDRFFFFFFFNFKKIVNFWRCQFFFKTMSEIFLRDKKIQLELLETQKDLADNLLETLCECVMGVIKDKREYKTSFKLPLKLHTKSRKNIEENEIWLGLSENCVRRA